jgi:hypothetical protein
MERIVPSWAGASSTIRIAAWRVGAAGAGTGLGISIRRGDGFDLVQNDTAMSSAKLTIVA